MSDKKRYFSYLIRFWKVPGGSKGVWRFSLERPGSGHQQAFCSLEELVAYFREEMGKEVPENEPQNPAQRRMS